MSNQNSLSVFGESALALDGDFGELQRLGGQLERLDIETDNGLDRAREVLAEFAACGQRVGEGIQRMAQGLGEQRERAERTARLVSARAAEIERRQGECDEMIARFKALAERVRETSAAVAALKSADQAPEQAAGRLPELAARFDALEGEAVALRRDARERRMKGLERNAESLANTLGSARRKLAALLPRAGQAASGPADLVGPEDQLIH